MGDILGQQGHLRLNLRLLKIEEEMDEFVVCYHSVDVGFSLFPLHGEIFRMHTS